MSSAERAEEGCPLAPLQTGGNGPDIYGDNLLPNPILIGASRRTRSRSGTFGLLYAKFYSFRPLVRLLIVFCLGLVPIYYLGLHFGADIRRYFGRPPPRPPGYTWLDEEDTVDAPWPIPPSAPFHEKPTPEIWHSRAQEVKDAFAHAYRGYEAYAFPNDELLPITRGAVN